ncbi:MAG: glycosyl transferase [Anaerocolumna sp.]|jgi:glycosyltransferase involved in cell wall biosynthesis|nr:glycosyl transferase [Anaerocolumna sp.]
MGKINSRYLNQKFVCKVGDNMIGLFSFDGPMYRDKNGVYCNTTITSEMFSRYFSVVDKLIVVIRTFHLEKTYEEASLKKVELDGLEFIEIPNLNSIHGFLFDRSKYKKIIFNQVEASDLIFARMPSSISDITIQIARKMGKHYMVEVGGCAWDSFWNHGLLGKFIASYMYLNEVIGVRHASFASYVTEKWLQSRYPCKCPSISASNVYLMPLKQIVLNNRISKIMSKNRHNPFVIGTTAAVNVKYKGQEYIIRAIFELNKKGYNFEYELVGGGDNSYLKWIVKKLDLEEKVRFKGLLLHDDVFDWLDSIDIYAQPSKQEGLPRALIEAMSRGCPAIGSTTAGIPELLDKEVVFKNGDIEKICNILMEIVSKDLCEFATRNFNKAKEFELENLDKKRNIIYKEYKDYVEKSTL